MNIIFHVTRSNLRIFRFNIRHLAKVSILETTESLKKNPIKIFPHFRQIPRHESRLFCVMRFKITQKWIFTNFPEIRSFREREAEIRIPLQMREFELKWALNDTFLQVFVVRNATLHFWNYVFPPPQPHKKLWISKPNAY